MKLKRWIRYFLNWGAVPRRQDSLERRFPTCRFYEGASVDAASTLERCNVIFSHTSISRSSLGSHTFVQRNSKRR